jgi:hypothetical protein
VWEVFDAASHAQLTGATLARWALLKFGAAPRRKPAAPRGGGASQSQAPRRRERGSRVMDMAF